MKRLASLAATFAFCLAAWPTQVEARVPEDRLAACSAYAQLELASMYGAPVSLTLYNDENARLVERGEVVDGLYLREQVEIDGLLRLPDGSEQLVHCTCGLTSPGEPVGLRCVPRSQGTVQGGQRR
ncbi:hypothetical protein [Nitratidesulfovibrio vulgaris]|uniref:Conserved domain protein n=1 Tax=Nitratidesulfovibrio vulgaris (strain ATCC 29579 / DSM 644 / CCUG 34227 / NCIMB 8303 / VKM B-1760 / Hildenborough) TaxID=882 RepID=Q728H6_NITV2|nr:hypothetical protein [Nitratidesulfovibrio vulgaris]AAS97099.1 conserved domain protein [Nitratidesulfovibrio vulgaris str. Hildenborough]ADP87566.1 hypothetical protein Deval_2423 [Nitratidesulfovibrio vulgaris RCH1]WCB47411.1 hypothetical protein PH214_04835 [Nitratidesulfovibrio vulgaris]